MLSVAVHSGRNRWYQRLHVIAAGGGAGGASSSLGSRQAASGAQAPTDTFAASMCSALTRKQLAHELYIVSLYRHAMCCSQPATHLSALVCDGSPQGVQRLL